MNLIQKYNDLNILETIIFWGVILLIILIIILAIILIIKKKTNKKEISIDTHEELPIIKEEQQSLEKKEQEEIFIPQSEAFVNEDNSINENIDNIIQLSEEKPIDEIINPIAKQKEPENLEKEEETIEENKEEKYKTSFEMPTAPYQRNVLREMALSQTSPIGINKKQNEYQKQEETIIFKNNDESFDLNQIKEKEAHVEQIINNQEINKEEISIFAQENINKQKLEELTEEQLDEYHDEIERTSYEIEQEENAIISYKELMEKKDSIQTIDEEDAIISIEELLNKTSSKNEIEEKTKLYNISEEEENDSFINELKQFRKDL